MSNPDSYHREKSAHDRASNLIKIGLAIAFAYPSLIVRMASGSRWELASAAMGAFWITGALYVGAIFALSEIRMIRQTKHKRRRAVRGRGDKLAPYMVNFDLVALLLAAVLPMAVIMLSSDLVHPNG